MASTKKIKCSKKDCSVKGFWYEVIGGELYYCHKAMAHGEKHIIKTKVRDMFEKAKGG